VSHPDDEPDPSGATTSDGGAEPLGTPDPGALGTVRLALPQAASSPALAIDTLGREGDAFAGLTALGPLASERKARDWALVLQSMSMWHVIRRSYAGWVVLVRDADYARASEACDRYEAENRDWPPRPARERPRHSPSVVAPALFAALIAFFLVTGPSTAHSGWFARGTAVAHLVLSSAPWQAVTALTLHGNGEHVLGNAVSGTIFASAVQRRLGPGGGALAVLVSGILGNVVNAFYHLSVGDGEHRSIGASTAVMGAIGILAATQLALDRPARTERRHWTEIVAPIIGGFALLGAIGSGSPDEPGRTDLGAHLFGFLAGVLVGLVAAFAIRRASVSIDLSSRYATRSVALGAGEPRAWVQAALGAVAAAIVLVAWQLAIRR